MVDCDRSVGSISLPQYSQSHIHTYTPTLARTWIQCCRSRLLAVQSRYATLAPPPSICSMRFVYWMWIHIIREIRGDLSSLKTFNDSNSYSVSMHRWEVRTCTSKTRPGGSACSAGVSAEMSLIRGEQGRSRERLHESCVVDGVAHQYDTTK